MKHDPKEPQLLGERRNPNDDDALIPEKARRPISGHDASWDQASIGEGNGADAYGADFTGGLPRSIEDTPEDEDIAIDRIERFPAAPPPSEVELTAQPDEKLPMELDELPEELP